MSKECFLLSNQVVDVKKFLLRKSGKALEQTAQVVVESLSLDLLKKIKDVVMRGMV